jgi:hypothetical protein
VNARVVEVFEYYVAGGYGLTGLTFVEWRKQLNKEVREDMVQAGKLLLVYIAKVLRDPDTATADAMGLKRQAETE